MRLTRIPDIFVLGPNDFRQTMPVKKVAEGTYRGETHIGGRRGLFRVRPLEDSAIFPETGLYREEEEMTQFGNNESLLRRSCAIHGWPIQSESVSGV